MERSSQKATRTYLALTLQSVDEAAQAKMGFEPVHEDHRHIEVRAEHTDDVRRILNAIKDGGRVVASTFASPTSKRFSSSSPERRSCGNTCRGKGGGMTLRVVAANLDVS